MKINYEPITYIAIVLWIIMIGVWASFAYYKQTPSYFYLGLAINLFLIWHYISLDKTRKTLNRMNKKLSKNESNKIIPTLRTKTI